MKMSHADTRRWESARTLADIGQLTALWLEGQIKSQPGYEPGWGPDTETLPLVPTLAALCRAGYVTTNSQPGESGRGADGRWYEQKAAAEGFVSDPGLYRRLVTAAGSAGLTVAGGTQVIVTTCNGRPYTAFGGVLGARDMQAQWSVLNRGAFAELTSAMPLTIAAPEYGEAGQRMWRVLSSMVGR
ncbi:DUF6919 domain-containing protein [Streptomyces sp. NPDC097727]|uniref:DUF6919 domain-containing protein n=1 Tax=Streptomyces sp. NPDC097727 TaxID=3366092 RepID=UPI00380AA516